MFIYLFVILQKKNQGKLMILKQCESFGKKSNIHKNTMSKKNKKLIRKKERKEKRERGRKT